MLTPDPTGPPPTGSRGPGPPVTLVCLHHAGGHPSLFRPWSRAAPDGVEVAPVVLPTTGGRVRRRRHRTADGLVPVLADRLEREVDDGGYVLFGYSMGGLLAYLLARRFCEGGGPRPAALAVAAFGAPHLSRPDLGSTGDDRELARRLYEIGGIPQWLVRNPEWLEPFLGLVRDDADLCASYRHRPQERPLGVPVHVFGGEEDLLFPPEAVRAWTEVAEEVEVVFHPGGHFLLAEDSGRIRNAVFGIADRCRQYA
ncbi:thioesterase II family protein [Nocardiopsis chromatogenes]|uniref:thioesterase II family protein n=1 Tax=Nocardiopsis chromatogenes TaxID=280239 RepID=UPI00034D097E|nr:alpha/beta fold hydrolase [Nocardiopsis chromatogenes]